MGLRMSVHDHQGCIDKALALAEPERRHELLLLICERCHTVEERPALELLDAAAREIAHARFTPHRQSFEVRGLCAECVEAP